MTAHLFLADLVDPVIGESVTVTGTEGRHAVTVKRIGVGENVLLSNGAGLAVSGIVTAVGRGEFALTIEDIERSEPRVPRLVAVQALAKGDRAERAVQMMTELGVDEIVPWQAERCVVKWTSDRTAKSLHRWRSTAREATKQSRQFRVPVVSEPVSTTQLAARVGLAQAAFVLHEDADEWLVDQVVPSRGEVLLVIGPEGGISSSELEQLLAAGARQVRVADAVLRTSTAGAVALAQIDRR